MKLDPLCPAPPPPPRIARPFTRQLSHLLGKGSSTAHTHLQGEGRTSVTEGQVNSHHLFDD